MNYWILQANPKIYDAVTALSGAGGLDRWRVARYLKDLEPGDKFALWISGRDSGVYAFGVITGPVTRDKDPDPLWQDPADGSRIDWRVGIRIEEILDNPIMRRAPRVPQRTANDGRGRAATVTRSAEQIQWQETFGLVTGSWVAG
jgi:EVE domain